jgi:hypothetical protein
MKDGDPRDGLLLMRIGLYFGPPCFVLLTAAWFKLLHDEAISLGVFLLLLVLNVPITLAGVEVIYQVVHRTAVGLTKTLLADGDIPPPPSYPNQDVLIAQGKYAEAAEYFRDHIRVDPDDCDARFRLADLLERHLADPTGAEQQLLDVRRRSPDPRRQYAASNALIDLYRKSGRRDRLKVELARFAQRYRGTPRGEAAARELKGMKEEERA